MILKRIVKPRVGRLKIWLRMKMEGIKENEKHEIGRENTKNRSSKYLLSMQVLIYLALILLKC